MVPKIGYNSAAGSLWSPTADSPGQRTLNSVQLPHPLLYRDGGPAAFAGGTVIMKPLQTSSGDLNADRRADYAEMLFASGDPTAAAELLLGALELAPQWSMGWFRLGEMQEISGRLDLAGQAWAMSLKLDPADRQGAALKLQLIGRAPVAAAPR